jgi:poly(hydroxyalkanoate) depolymerase family esterase
MIGKWRPTQVSHLVGAVTDIADRWRHDPLQWGSGFADGPSHGMEAERPWSSLGIPEPVRDLLHRLGQLGVPGLDGVIDPTPSRAPDPLRYGARFETRSYANEAGSRVYKLYIPSGYSGQALPLVVMLHGCTQVPDSFASGTQMNALAEEQRFLVAYPAQSPAANAMKCWTWSSAADRSLVAGITRQVMCEFPVDPERVYIAGFSAGGAMAAIMGSEYSDLYAAVGVHSGPACKSSSRKLVPTILFHGDCDILVHPINGDKAIIRSRAGAALQTTVKRGQVAGGAAYTRTVYSDRGGYSVLEHWLLHELGHGWSGGAPHFHTEPRGPDASREMVRFFLARSRRG